MYLHIKDLFIFSKLNLVSLHTMVFSVQLDVNGKFHLLIAIDRQTWKQSGTIRNLSNATLHKI